jgi:hypothetical protein
VRDPAGPPRSGCGHPRTVTFARNLAADLRALGRDAEARALEES